MTDATTLSEAPVKHEVANVFVPVLDVNLSREWYRDVLGLPVGEVVFGHLCIIELERGPSLILDQKLTPDGPADIQRGRYPLFMLATDDIDAALAHMRRHGVEVVEYDGEVIQNGHWFNFRDCDGNLLMMCA
ncbi:MAG TPA: VOC family protein [Trueperaceae bacterium]